MFVDTLVCMSVLSNIPIRKSSILTTKLFYLVISQIVGNIGYRPLGPNPTQTIPELTYVPVCVCTSAHTHTLHPHTGTHTTYTHPENSYDLWCCYNQSTMETGKHIQIQMKIERKFKIMNWNILSISTSRLLTDPWGCYWGLLCTWKDFNASSFLQQGWGSCLRITGEKVFPFLRKFPWAQRLWRQQFYSSNITLPWCLDSLQAPLLTRLAAFRVWSNV